MLIIRVPGELNDRKDVFNRMEIADFISTKVLVETPKDPIRFFVWEVECIRNV